MWKPTYRHPSWILNDNRNCLLEHRKKIAKFLIRTFTCRSTFLYGVGEPFFAQMSVIDHTVELRCRVADPRHFNADPDSASHFNADPDPAFHFHPDPDPAPQICNYWSADPPGLHFVVFKPPLWAATALHGSIFASLMLLVRIRCQLPKLIRISFIVRQCCGFW